MFSMRIVNSDFYIADPVPELDVCNSKFREDTSTTVKTKVPVIRIYGATPRGQKTCLHVHGIFPYIYVPYDGTQPTDKYIKQFATSVDFAVQVALGKASSSRRHVYEITVVKGTPYYGYHEGERDFLKIVLYNPFLVTRVVSLLQNGAIMNKVFQPHEAHIPYMLQFFMDYNLYGMNLIHASGVKFRAPVRLLAGEAETIPSPSSKKVTSPLPTQIYSSPLTQVWDEETVSKDLVLGSNIERLSFCELEADMLASDILNKLEIGVNIGSNPGLAAIWEDEQQRRREANESSHITAPPSDERHLIQETETEKNFKERIKEIINERDVLIQSQMGKLGREALSPKELASFQDSISSIAASQKDAALNNDSLDADAVLQLLSQQADESVAAAESSQVIIDEDEPVVNQSIVHEVVEASQRSFSQELSSSLDQEMVNILASLAEEPSQPCASQKAPLSQSVILDQGDVPCDEEANEDEELSESEESIMMSQKVWDDIEPALSAETGDDQGDVQDGDNQYDRPSQYDMEGMMDTWIGSFLGGDIPQLDGAADEESDKKEDFKIRREKSTKIKTKKSFNSDDKISRDVIQNSTLNLISSWRNEKHDKNEESEESCGVNVWPNERLAVRTYSRKSMSVPKNRKTPSLNLEMVAMNCDEDKQQEKSRDEFKLFLCDSSDSESETIKERNVGSKQNEMIVYPQTRQILEEHKSSRAETSTSRNCIETSRESCTSVITKYFHSPVKNPECSKRQDGLHSRSEGKCSAPFELSGGEVLPQCSKQQELNLRKSSLRKRKLTEVDQKEHKLGKGVVTRRASKKLDVLASLGVVSDAMKDLTVSLQDISHTRTLSSKLSEAKQRLRKMNEEYTAVRGRLNSPIREQKPLVNRSPQLRKNGKSPLSRAKSSPRIKEERSKRYGVIPVMIEKSPKKSQVVIDNLVPDTNRPLTETSSPNPYSARNLGPHACDYTDPNINCGTGQASSRNRAQVMELLSSQSTTSTVGSIETSSIPSVSSRALTLKSDSKLRGKSRNETRQVLSLRKRGLKRKRMIDTGKKEMKPKPSKDTSGIRKKRKLSFTLSKTDKTCLDDGNGCDKETSVTSAENCSVKDCKSVSETDDFICETQLDNENNSSFFRSEAKTKFAPNTGLLEGITCIPASPIDSDSNGDSVSNAESSTASTELKLLTLPAPSCSKFNDSADSSVSSENRGGAFDNACDNLNGSLLLSQELFPKERDTELLANALFNMSLPSPLPLIHECYSPPCPSSPSDANRLSLNQLKSEGNLVKQQQFFIVNSDVVNEDEDSVLGDGGISASSLSKVNHTEYRSTADGPSRAKLSLLESGPQLGETQTTFESTFVLHNDPQACRHVENSYNCSNEVDLEIVGESCVKNSESNAISSVEGNVTRKEKDCISNLGSTVPEENSTESTTNRVTWSNTSVSESRGLEAKRTLLLRAGAPDFVEAGEKDFDPGEFMLRMNVAENSSNEFQPVEQCNPQNEEMEICVEVDGRDRPLSTGNPLNCHFAAELHAKPGGIYKSSNDSANAPQSVSNSFSLEPSKSNSFKCKNIISIEPLKWPPSSEELLNSLKDYGLPQCRYQRPFCSDPVDVPSCPREVGGRILRIETRKVSSLPEFETAGSLPGLKHWRFVLSSAREFSLRDLGQTIEAEADFEKNVQLKIALMGDGDVVVTPCRGPPTPQAVKAWARDKMAQRKRGTSLKKAEQKQETSQDGNLEKVVTKQLSNQTKTVADDSKTLKFELNQVIQKSSPPKIPPDKISNGSGGLVLKDHVSVPVQKQKVLDGIDRDKKTDVIDLSDSSSPAEVTSPGSLFSPNEEKMCTLASSFTQNGKHNLCEISGTQPITINRSLGFAVYDEKLHQADNVTTETNSPPNVVTQCKAGTPPSRISPEGTPQLSPLTIKQLLSPTFQTQDFTFSAPHHSTPVATKLVYGLQSPRCTPISAATNVKSLETSPQNPVKSSTGHQASSDQTPSLRQQLLASQFKFVTPGFKPRCHLPWSSQIDGPSPNNTYGFKVSQINLKDTKALHEVQHLTLFSLELHVRTRRDMRPDPEFDPICAIFYYIQTDTPLPSGKNRVTGIICVDPESAKICSCTTENKEASIPITNNTTPVSPSNQTIVSTSSRATQNTKAPHLRSLLSRSGITDHDIQYVAEEKDLFPALIRIIRRWDPDILIGFEIQMFSWGFLLERALVFEIDFCSWLSRVKGSSSDCNMDAEKDVWGAAHTSEFKIAGRIILNVWRLMRHEAAVNSYSFENVAFHVLHERIPLYSFRTLSDWWDQRTSLNRWRTVDHYVTRCRCNVRILESLDFIGRTSELARLFGILFFSVISRGSQYRVESMMLRIAKPMNYIAVSPSIEQRGLMRAPETIPLVMEPESRFYSDPVLVLDFQSLYPSMVIAYNYCFSTCLGRVSCLSEYGEFKFGATSLCVPPSLLRKLEGDIHVSPSGVAFVKSNIRRGVLPSMLEEILETRIMVKASMKKWKSDKALGRMLDARQLGLKLIANVTFGYTSAHFSGRMPCVEIGDSIVRKARETLERAIDLVNNTPRWSARVVYGDTDSLFVLLKGATKEQAFNIGKDIVDTVTAMNPKPVKLKFEKVYLPCVLQTKKRYVGYMYETLDQKEPVFDAKGIETVRRDSIPAVAKILEKSLRILFETRDLSLIKKYVQRQCTKLMEGRVSLQDFTFAKEYRGMKSYKPGACVPALELTRRMLREDRRSEPRVRERVPYVVVYGSPGLPLIQLVRRPHEVLQDPGLRLNASYYITKQILPPLNRVFSLIGLDVFTWYAELPRVVRVAQMRSDPGERKKGTISQYFSTMACPVCQDLTPTDLCAKCRGMSQKSAVILTTRMHRWERTYQHLAEICHGCSGSRDTKLRCVSLDCPVFYKLVQCTRDLRSSEHFRKILDSL